MTEELPKPGVVLNSTHLIIFPLICLGLFETHVKLFMPKASRNNEFCNCSRCWLQTHLPLHSLNTTWCPLIFVLHNKMNHRALSIFSTSLIIFWTLLHCSSVKSLQIEGFYLNWPPTEAITYFLSYLLAFPVLSHLQLILLEKEKQNCTWHLTCQGFIKRQQKEKKTPLWRFILLIPLPVIPRISFSLWLMKASAILRRTEAPLAQVAKAIWEWFLFI